MLLLLMMMMMEMFPASSLVLSSSYVSSNSSLSHYRFSLVTSGRSVTICMRSEVSVVTTTKAKICGLIIFPDKLISSSQNTRTGPLALRKRYWKILSIWGEQVS